ncbi:hypothetical protein H4R35_007619, partial [Dimargaris xerosporica]
GYFDDVLAFIDRMSNNPYLAWFGQHIQVDTGLNYYECAAYTALYMHSKKVAIDFVNQLQSKPGVKIHRLYQCIVSGNSVEIVRSKLESAFDRDLLFQEVSEAECGTFIEQLKRGSDFMYGTIMIYTDPAVEKPLDGMELQ